MSCGRWEQTWTRDWPCRVPPTAVCCRARSTPSLRPSPPLKVGVNPRLQVGPHDGMHRHAGHRPAPSRTRHGGPPPPAACTPPLTALVLVLPAGAVKDPVAPLKGADAGPRGATLHPRPCALAVHWQRGGRETAIRLGNQGNCPSPPEFCHPPHITRGKKLAP